MLRQVLQILNNSSRIIRLYRLPLNNKPDKKLSSVKNKYKLAANIVHYLPVKGNNFTETVKSHAEHG